ncbi:polyadenylate-binding protein 2-like isoform X1 [Zingiber officinale]|uniref:polyadenylate-binding protein 2-like isoform X1 n=1 Tax=Zingiber officinale TaxID=94328 RepID=UPI001C4D0B04|nr:polyadenylate-binding protein 2-like isoform X1 [Zingiber officinale]
MAQSTVEQQTSDGEVNNGGGNQIPLSSLYVGDLHPSVTEPQIFEFFSQIGPVISVRLCQDSDTRRSLGYAYVNYSNPADAAMALDVLNFTLINNKPIRIMYSNRDPSIRKSGSANVFIKNLDKTINNKALHEIFSSFGSILSCKIVTDTFGQSKGYGFVQFDREEAAQSAISKLNGALMNDKPVYVGPFVRKQERENSADKTKFTNVFVKNLSESTTKEDLENIFGKYGKITSAVVMIEEDGKSKCFGFVNFDDPDAAALAVQELNGQQFDDKEWYVGKALKKSERDSELREKIEQTATETIDKYHGLNLYLKNLDDSIGDDKLVELFSGFGIITSCKVMREPNGMSKGSGFVAFSAPEEASRALAEMNGKMVGGKPLYVAVAQRKEERKARLQAQFSQVRPVTMIPNVGPRVPIYPPGAPGMGQQIFYGQTPPTLVPPQPGFGFQQQLIPGMRPGGPPMPNFFMPVVQQGQQGHRPSGRRSGGPVQQMQQPMPLIQQQQMLPRGRVQRYAPGRNMSDVPMPGIVGGMLSPYDMGGLGYRDIGMSQSIPIGTLASALANATFEQQRMMLGENLYPLVEQYERDHAAKVTGMLLEMDQTEVLHLLESPEALKAKVAEAMEVLLNVAQQQQGNAPSDQLAALSLSDGLVS